MIFYLSRLHFPVTTLGPGRRIGIWFQGCSIACEGCISADTWPAKRGRTTVEAVITAIEPWLGEADGLTVSGGEPFDQTDALLGLLGAVQARRQMDVLVFSGYPVEMLHEKLKRLTGKIDALISDPYDINAPQTLPLRGSDNQRLHLLTDLGRERFSRYQFAEGEAGPVLDIMFEGDGTAWIAGIPRKDDLRRFTESLGAAGTKVTITQAPPRVRAAP
jgi:anaerobic ribonucleoside-triphosphate reductase activating protein